MIRAPYLLERLHLVHSKLQNVVEYSLPDGVVMARVLELRFVTPNPIVIAKVLKSSKRPWFGDSNTIQPERRKPGFPGRRRPFPFCVPCLRAGPGQDGGRRQPVPPGQRPGSGAGGRVVPENRRAGLFLPHHHAERHQHHGRRPAVRGRPDLRAELETKEYQRVPVVNGAAWDTWVPKFLARHCETRETFVRYEDAWKWIALWLQRQRIHAPRQLTYRLGVEYVDWRTNFKKRTGKTVRRNTAILELKLLSLIMGEAVRMGHADANPIVSIKIRREKSAKKPELTDQEIVEIRQALRELVELPVVIGHFQLEHDVLPHLHPGALEAFS